MQTIVSASEVIMYKHTGSTEGITVESREAKKRRRSLSGAATGDLSLAVLLVSALTSDGPRRCEYNERGLSGESM